MNAIKEKNDFLYLDHAASSVMFSEVNDYLYSFNKEYFGNPASIHQVGVRSTKEIERARDLIASQCGVNSESVIFTSGGTESNNWIIFSVLLKFKNNNRKQIITSEIEHPSVLKPLEYYSELFGYELKKVRTLPSGQVDIEHFKSLASEQVLFCSFMQVNNETGVELQIKEISNICQELAILLHVDACQGFLKSELDYKNINFITINSHKVHGPKGVGALVSNNNDLLLPMMIGGGHEMGYRSGTLNTSGIVGFSKAIEVFKEKQTDFKKINFKKMLHDRLKQELKGFNLNGCLDNSSEYILNFSLDGVHAKDLFKYLNARNIFVSTSSACSSKLFKPSYVLASMGKSEIQNFEAVRMSFSPEMNLNDLEKIVQVLKEYVRNEN